ncbi:S41 family peptidase [Planctomycetota bacterium]|nr:S41 family peptidase [Planctomycetota bacterium]
MRGVAFPSTGLILGVALILGAAVPGQAQDARAHDELFESAWSTVRDQFYDRDLHGVDWEATRDRYRARVRQAQTRVEACEVITEMLAELRASHVAIVERGYYENHYDSEAKSLPAPMYGIAFASLDEGYFVASVLHGSSAAAAGVLRGDKVLSIDGQSPGPESLLPSPYDSGLGGTRYYHLPIREEGSEAVLELERFPRPRGRFHVTIQSVRWSQVEACRESIQVVERHGVKLGYMRLYHLLTEDIVDMLGDALARRFADADVQGVVVDLRGMGGLPVAVERVLNYFDPNLPGGPLWGRPAVALIDGRTRSAKELLAFDWRQRRIGPIVGTTTRGAVLGARFEPLQDGSFMLVPVMDMRSMTGGRVLERNGVAPDIEVTVDLAWSEGVDSIYEAGLEVLFDEVLAARRAGKEHGWR